MSKSKIKRQLEERITKLENKLTIKEKKNVGLSIAFLTGKDIIPSQDTKEDALIKIKTKKQDKINELTIYFE